MSFAIIYIYPAIGISRPVHQLGKTRTPANREVHSANTDRYAHNRCDAVERQDKKAPWKNAETIRTIKTKTPAKALGRKIEVEPVNRSPSPSIHMARGVPTTSIAFGREAVPRKRGITRTFCSCMSGPASGEAAPAIYNLPPHTTGSERCQRVRSCWHEPVRPSSHPCTSEG